MSTSFSFHPNFFIEDKEGNDSPVFLERTLGSLSSERAQSKRKSYAKYNKKVSEFRKEAEPYNLLSISTPQGLDDFNIKLSRWMALYPSTSFSLTFNVQELVHSNLRLLRSFLVYYYTNRRNFNEYVIFEIEQSLDSFLSVTKAISSKIVRENYIIRQTFLILGEEAGLELLNEVYSKDNLRKWFNTGKSLCKSYQVVKIPYAVVKEKVRRRGYKETKRNKLNSSLSARRNADMSIESKQLEEIKERIKLKQARLFEERLDRYLELGDPNIPKEKKKEIFNSLLEAKLDIEEKDQQNIHSEEGD